MFNFKRNKACQSEDFKTLVAEGLHARDIAPIRLKGQKRELLALLCSTQKNDKIYALIQKKKPIKPFVFLYSSIDASEGVVYPDACTVDGKYYELDYDVIVPLIVVNDLRIKKNFGGSNHVS